MRDNRPYRNAELRADRLTVTPLGGAGVIDYGGASGKALYENIDVGMFREDPE
jgi:hypothetical protein